MEIQVLNLCPGRRPGEFIIDVSRSSIEGVNSQHGMGIVVWEHQNQEIVLVGNAARVGRAGVFINSPSARDLLTREFVDRKGELVERGLGLRRGETVGLAVAWTGFCNWILVLA